MLTAGYRGDGLRGWKQPNGGTKTYFLYDGGTPVCELDSSGNVTAANTWGANGLLARRTGSTSVFYTFDPQGGTSQRLDGSANVLTSHMFDAFGVGASTSSTTDPYAGYGAQWGYYRDSETGLQLLTHRYFDSGTGRFVNRDPISYPGGVNLYTYVANNPTSWADPLGLDPGLRPPTGVNWWINVGKIILTLLNPIAYNSPGANPTPVPSPDPIVGPVEHPIPYPDNTGRVTPSPDIEAYQEWLQNRGSGGPGPEPPPSELGGGVRPGPVRGAPTKLCGGSGGWRGTGSGGAMGAIATVGYGIGAGAEGAAYTLHWRHRIENAYGILDDIDNDRPERPAYAEGA